MENKSSPLAKKLQIKPGKRWLIVNGPEGFPLLLEPLPTGSSLQFNTEGAPDGILLFVKNRKELAEEVESISPLLRAATVFWVIYLKTTPALKTGLETMQGWDDLKKHHLRPVASAAIDGTWTALRFKAEGQSKLSDFSNKAIKTNAYAEYIDADKRQINLPGDMKTVLEQSAAAMDFYQGLSFSNKKEYVVWILSAKQQKTRTERLQKLTDKLLSGKKNPSEK